ncbi:peptide receptor gpcr [Plakobranchus ocellatus]|uniref:Peptide receptor gpcr n=1 Tax=Plakobranchus ocellatus TaxID=259542 RepID=A0AAV3Y581_9GAST|nr:peptide receptor gpcr [Plakobranchus ocellatus]
MFLSLSGVAYELYFGLRSDQPIDLSGDNDLLHYLPAEMETYLSAVMLRNTVKIQDFAMAFNTTDREGLCGQVSRHLGLYARLVNVSATDQATLQRHLLDLRHARFTLNMGRWTMGFQAYPSEKTWHSMHPTRRQSPQTLSACVIIVSNSHLEQTREGIRIVGTTTPDPAVVREPPLPVIRISSLLECPKIALTPDEFTLPPNGHGDNLHLKWEGAGNLTENKYLLTMEGNVSICLEDFLSKLGFDRSKRSHAEKIVVSVLLPISIMCLLATLSVFLAFSALRNLPGKTNIIFVICLLCSQAALFLVYLESDVRTQACAVKGAVAHYFGLSVFVAQAACSYHVYTAFTTMHLSSVLKREGKYLAVYCAVTFILPLLIVGVVVTLNVFSASGSPSRSPGDSTPSSIDTARHNSVSYFGYGGGALCLLSTPLAVWVSLLLPVIVFLAAAVALFALTYSSLRHTIKDLETSSRDIRHVHFYFRVSLMTSLAWILAIVGHVTALPIFRIAFVVVYCFVGCYTFFTLVLTRQVTRLVTGCCCGSRRPPMGRTSLNLKMVPATECHARNPCIVATGFKPTGSRTEGRRGGRGSGRAPILEGEAKNTDTLKPEEIDYRQSGEYEQYFFNQEGGAQGVRFAETAH